MKILKVTVTDRVTVSQTEDIGSGNVNTVKCVFSLPESFEGLLPIATFKKDGAIYNKTIINNECYVPHEILQETGYVFFGVYAFDQVDGELKLRISPILSGFKVDKGSYMGEGQESTVIEPSDFEMYMQAMNKIKAEAQNIIDSFSAEDVVFLDGDTFQEKLDKGELMGVVSQPEEPENDALVWVDTDEEGDVLDLTEYEERLDYLEETFENLNLTQYAERLDEVEAKADEVDTFNDRINAVEEKANNIDEYNNRLNTLEDKVDVLDEHTEKLNTLDEDVNTLKGQVEVIGEHTEILNNQNESLNTLEGRVADLEQVGPPEKGVDYWTEEDIADIESYCDSYIDTKITDAIGGEY